MDPEKQFQFLKNIIKEFNTKIKCNTLSKEKSMSEYDTFKRYTTSRKDHGPQTRLVYNVRKRWPILINKTNDIPEKFNGTYLKSKKVEIGTSTRVGANIVVPDYWLKFGTDTDLEVAEALIEHEKEKVERFFNSEWGELQFFHSYPYRKPVIVSPTIEDVSSGNINNTLLQLFCPQFTTLDVKSKANLQAVEKLKMKIGKIADLKSYPSTVHLARSLITSEKKWLPVLVSHTPESAELSHFLCSKYHNIPLKIAKDTNVLSMERLCGEIVKNCLTMENPKMELIDTLKKIKILKRSLDELLVDQEADSPYISICRVALGLGITYSKRIRDTRFIIMESESPRIERKAEWKLGLLSQTNKYMCFVGHSKVFFQWYNSKGFVIAKGNVISEIFITSEPGTYLLPLILDILYYFASIEPGFEHNYGQYFKTSELFNQFFIYHHNNLLPTLEHLNIGPLGVLSNSFHWKIKSKGFLKKVKELEVPVQPYEQSRKEYMVNDNLEVYLVHPAGLSKMLEPSEASIPQNVPLPMGLDASGTGLIDIIKNPLIKIKTALKSLAQNPERCQELVTNAINGEEDRFSPMINQIMPINNYKKANRKRLLEVVKDPNWLDSPRKRLKASFDAMVALSVQNRKRKQMSKPLDNISFRNVPENFSYCFDKGVVIDSRTTLRVMGEVVDRVGFMNKPDYVQTGVYDTKPDMELVYDVDDAMLKGLKKFCVQSHGRYFVVEHKHNIWSESDNIKESIKRQMDLSKTVVLEKRMRLMAGLE